MKDLSPPFLPLDKKLKLWPKRYLGKTLDCTAGPGAAFVELKNTRNRIVHFTSTHETFRVENATIHGLADFTEYDSLNYDNARTALETAEALVAEIFRLADVPPERISDVIHAWTGKIAV